MYTTCKSDMFLKSEDPDKMKYGSTISEYGFEPDLKVNFMLANPRYGTSWKQDMVNLNVVSLRFLHKIAADILKLVRETDGLLKEIIA